METAAQTPTPAAPQTDVITSLTELATEVAALGLRAAVREPPGQLPYLDVRNPRASSLTEKVFVQADRFYFSWAEPIAGRDEPATAAAILARVLRTADGE
jgi:hypothetical protein